MVSTPPTASKNRSPKPNLPFSKRATNSVEHGRSSDTPACDPTRICIPWDSTSTHGGRRTRLREERLSWNTCKKRRARLIWTRRFGIDTRSSRRTGGVRNSAGDWKWKSATRLEESREQWCIGPNGSSQAQDTTTTINLCKQTSQASTSSKARSCTRSSGPRISTTRARR